MKYIKASIYDAKAVHEIVHNSIIIVYPKYYPQEVLDASLPASHMYEKRSYQTKEHCKWPVDNGVIPDFQI